jgi:hypothetical protein
MIAARHAPLQPFHGCLELLPGLLTSVAEPFDQVKAFRCPVIS